MELSSIGLELRAIRTVTSPSFKDGQRTSMLGRLNVSHFSSEVTRKVIRRLAKLVESRGEVLDWDDLLEDPNLPEDFRDELRESEDQPAKSTKGFERIYDGLEKYRKRRHIATLGRRIAKDLDNDEEDFDEDTYLREVADELNQAQKGSNLTEKVWTFGGKKGNAVKLAKQAINNPQELMYKTGYRTYDDKNGGWPTTGVVLLAGSTSGGKSVMSMNIADRMSRLNNIHTLKITLEMTAEQEMNRMLAMIAGIPFWKIKQKKLSDREKKKLIQAATDYDKKLRKSKSKNSFVSPERGMSIEDVLYMTIPYGVQVSFIDYVGLLEGVDSDNQWRELSTIVRKAKVHAQRTGQLVVILCQLDDQSGRIRYSGGMREHADVVWAWNYSDPEVREGKIIPVQVMKARDGELFEMPLVDMFETMRVEDADPDTPIPEKASSALEDDSGAKKFKKGKGSFSKKGKDDIPLKKNRRSAKDFLKGNDRDDDIEDDIARPKRKKKKDYSGVS